MTKKLITVVGATGAQGGGLAKSILGDPSGEFAVRAVTRKPTGDAARALALLGAIQRDGAVTSPVRAHAASVAAAIHFHLGDIDNARNSLRDVLAAAVDEADRRQATAKLRALDGEPARRTLGRTLFGNDMAGGLDPVLAFYLLSEFARLHPDDALGPYLIGRQLATRDPRLALPFLRAACEQPNANTGSPLGTDFRRECQRMMILAAYRTGDLARSRAAAEALRAEAPNEAQRLRLGDFLARIAWRQAKE